MNEKLSRRFNLYLSQENYNYLEKINNQTNTTISKTINEYISTYRKKIDGDLKPTQKLANIYNVIDPQYVKFAITIDEREFLNQEAKRHGFKSAIQEIKFRLLSTIYDDGIATNAELKELKAPLKQMQIIGRNIDLLLMNLQTNRFVNFDKDKYDEFVKQLQELTDYIKLVEARIQKLQLQNKRRLGRLLNGSRKWQDADQD